jgi:hypothetical protein
MTVQVKRVYTHDSVDDTLLEDYLFAVVADDEECHYVFPKGSAVSGLDDARIADLTASFSEGAALSADQRISIATMNIFGVGFDGPVYANIHDAIAGEQTILTEAKEDRDAIYYDSDTEEEYDPEDDDLMVG